MPRGIQTQVYLQTGGVYFPYSDLVRRDSRSKVPKGFLHIPEETRVEKIKRERYAVGCEVAKIGVIPCQARTTMMGFEQKNAEAEGEHEFAEPAMSTNLSSLSGSESVKPRHFTGSKVVPQTDEYISLISTEFLNCANAKKKPP